MDEQFELQLTPNYAKLKYPYSDNDVPPAEGQKRFENHASYCGHCWRVISNKVYFGIRGNSTHITGKCKERQHEIPKAYFERRTDKPRSYDVLTAYWASSKLASGY